MRSDDFTCPPPMLSCGGQAKSLFTGSQAEDERRGMMDDRSLMFAMTRDESGKYLEYERKRR